jgi:hypothetical protein
LRLKERSYNQDYATVKASKFKRLFGPVKLECVMQYEFSLKYQVTANANTDQLIERLGAAGCDDALIGTGNLEHIALDFVRDATSLETALISALAAVQAAIPGATLIEVIAPAKA